jgi:PKD repeat protein
VLTSVTANGQSSLTLTKAGTVTLSVAVDNKSNYTYKWTQVSGPEVTITNATSQDASVSITANGEYEFKITVTNDGGYKFATGTCKVSATFTTSSAATLV